MVTPKHLEALAQWWSEQLPYGSESFRLRFKTKLVKQFNTVPLDVFMDPNSRPIFMALMEASVDNNETVKSLRDTILDFVATGTCAIIHDDHIIVELGVMPFVSEERLLREDGSTVPFCTHCLEEVPETVSLCDKCQTGYATCLQCRTQQAIPSIGRDGVCEECTTGEVYSILGELELANENRYLASKEEW